MLINSARWFGQPSRAPRPAAPPAPRLARPPGAGGPPATAAMPPKKDKKADFADDGDPGMNPDAFKTNYTKFCKLIAVPANQKIVDQLTDEEKLEAFMKHNQLVVDDEFGALGPHGTRALCTAIMGSGTGMNGAQCKLVKSLRLWRSNVSDDGAACIAELLRLGGAEVAISYLELLDNGIGARGARSLGQALTYGMNRSLLTLKLDYNNSLGSEGVVALCRGLRTNSTLKQLHLPYCNIDADGGGPLGEMLSYRQLTLNLLNLQGNHLGGGGLSGICDGLKANVTLGSLSVADNGIAQTDEDIAALEQLATIIMKPESVLGSVDMLYNRIGEKGANAMLFIFNGGKAEGKGAPSKVKQLLVDSTLPQQLFDHLCRIDAAGGGKKKKGKKGKKKK